MMYHQPQRNQMHYAPVHYPTMPPQMYQWPLDDGYMHSHGYGCCNHNYFPGHCAMRPPYPYHQHVSPMPAPSLYPFSYPAAQAMYPPPPYYHPPHCTTELPYDKDILKGGRDNCCGWCPNHPSGGNQEKDVKIEEVEPEVEKKTNGSLVPFEAKNYPYPVVWLQPDKEIKKPDNSSYTGGDKILGAQADENPKSFSQQPILWNGWFPYDMSRLQSSNQKEEQKKNNIHQHEEGAKSQQPGMWRGWFPFDLSKLETMRQGDEQGSNQHQKDDDKRRNFPFPLFWMPYKPSLTERDEEPEKVTERDISKNTASGVAKVPSHIINSQLEKHTDDKEAPRDISKKTTSGDVELPSHIINYQPEKQIDNKEKPEIYTSEGSQNLSNTNRVVKIIPVKQLVPDGEGNKKTSSKTVDERKKKPLEDCVNKESTSPPKTSKLPPVCLRVDPLPKRKGTNGKSRSPSPPGNKRKSDNASVKQDGLIVFPNLQKNDRHDDQVATATDKSKEEKRSNNTGTQAAKVAEQAHRQEGEVKLAGTSGDTVSHADATTVPNECNEEPAADSDAVRNESGYLNAKVVKTDVQSVTTEDSTAKAEDSNKWKFSDEAAATVIQAAYHGFEVRKSGTLKKLKKLFEVKEQVEGIKTQIQALESSCDAKNYDKQKTIITEMIMGLLLKLDTVQGLHTSIRDIRKSIAKELVSLQESLDALVIKEKSSEAQLEQPSGISFEESMPDLENKDITIECRRKDNDIDIHDLSKIDNKVSPSVELCETQVHETDSLSNPEALEKLEAVVTRESVDNGVRKNVLRCTSTEYFPGASDSAAVVGGIKKENDFQSPMADSSSDDEELELKQLFECQDLSREMSNFEDVSEEEVGKEPSNVLPLAVNDNGRYSEDVCSDDPKKREVSGDATKDIADVDEAIILNQQQVALEESQEESQECEEEKITDGTLSERPHESSDMPVSPSGEKSVVDTQVEVPKESSNTCEADETTSTEIPTPSEKAADCCEPDETISRDLSRLGQQVDVLPEDQKEQSLIEVPDLVHDEVQFVQVKPQDEDLGWERDAGSEPGSEIAETQHECLNGVSSLEHDALQVEIQEEDHEQGVDSLSESETCSDDTGLLLTTREEEISNGLRNECGHLANEESRVKEVLQENDYVFVSGGSAREVSPVFVSGGSVSEVSPDFCVEKFEERVNISDDEMENISPVVIPLGKMDAACLAPEESEGNQHVTGVNNQADELDLSISSPTSSQASLENGVTREIDRKLMEENDKLRDLMEKLLEAGNKQLSTISELSGRISDLEKKLARKKKKQLKCRRRRKALPPREVLV